MRMRINMSSSLDHPTLVTAKWIEPNDLCPVLPVFNLSPFLNNTTASSTTTTTNISINELCTRLAQCLTESGALVVRDDRLKDSDNDEFLDLMEEYFESDDKYNDIRPHFHYQVGATPENTERPRILRDSSIAQKAKSLPPDQRPTIPSGPDCKWRFFWRVGERPTHTRFPELNAEPVIPEKFADRWSSIMTSFGDKMLNTVKTVAEMLAIGLEIDKTSFTQRMRLGAHLLAPTGVDLDKYNKLGTVIAGYHYDLNFLTIHGRSRYPGLFIWLRNGQRIPVRIPKGCLLLQAGAQLQYLTGGFIQAGYHEVCLSSTRFGRF